METEVMMPSPASEFNFDSACTSPYISAPSSPARFGMPFYSAPTSPTRASAFYNQFTNFHAAASATGKMGGSAVSADPFNWEEKPGIPKDTHHSHDDDDEEEDKDFAFEFSGHLETCSLPADQLFDGGKIKPLKPPPCLQCENHKPPDHHHCPKSPKKIFKEAFSPRCRKKMADNYITQVNTVQQSTDGDHQRGRERSYNSSSNASSSRHKGSRSLSPLRVLDLLLDRQDHDNHKPKKTSSVISSSNSSSSPAPSFPSSWYRKWKIKDFLLFRSASEGRAASKAQLKKYAVLKKNSINHQDHEDLKNASFRSNDSVFSSVSSSMRRSSGPISAHELHYTINRALSEEMKKKTSLPYKQGLLGCLRFNQAVNEVSHRGIGSMSRV